ncbi:hypothetical protein DFH08DRAFT_806027 [Mycena albidolilacea]|uniref:Uncharacterized protein n=1 Tax=Mycena albidolilacea TaxID=1033008 RepID=A0AAD7A8C8_9AGAR|nr:hypothetical protein DFH08DRAFT_806027 [Mycena albidolilacea]
MSRVTGAEYENGQNVTKSVKIAPKIEISAYTVARAVVFARAALVDSFGHRGSLEFSWRFPTKVTGRYELNKMLQYIPLAPPHPRPKHQIKHAKSKTIARLHKSLCTKYSPTLRDQISRPIRVHLRYIILKVDSLSSINMLHLSVVSQPAKGRAGLTSATEGAVLPSWKYYGIDAESDVANTDLTVGGVILHECNTRREMLSLLSKPDDREKFRTVPTFSGTASDDNGMNTDVRVGLGPEPELEFDCFSSVFRATGALLHFSEQPEVNIVVTSIYQSNPSSPEPHLVIVARTVDGTLSDPAQARVAGLEQIRAQP